MFFFVVVVLLQLVEKENVRAVLSYNEAFELNFFTNNEQVSFGMY